MVDFIIRLLMPCVDVKCDGSSNERSELSETENWEIKSNSLWKQTEWSVESLAYTH
jgi:hypothetical protein